ncbi:hypothetical protein HN51_012880 [Arachis hypogaea]|nr:Putative alpha-L-fucosidase [Arachis hypogaea]
MVYGRELQMAPQLDIRGTIGYQRLLLFPKVKSQHLMLVINKSRADPLISYLGIYIDPVTIWSSIYDDTVLTSHFNAIQVIHIITQDNSHTGVTVNKILEGEMFTMSLTKPLNGNARHLRLASTIPLSSTFQPIIQVLREYYTSSRTSS